MEALDIESRLLDSLADYLSALSTPIFRGDEGGAMDLPAIILKVERGEELLNGARVFSISVDVSLVTSADEPDALAEHSAELSELRQLLFSSSAKADLTTDALAVLYLKNFAFRNEAEERHLVGAVSLEIICAGKN